MEIKYLVIAVCLAVASSVAFGQEMRATNIQSVVTTCYTNTTLLDRYRRSPMTIEHLIHIIRKIENHPEISNWDMQSVLAGIINRYKIDGLYAAVPEGSNYYAPEPFVETLESAKKALLMEMGYDPNINLPNNILTGEETCSLHWMISHSVNYTRREEEDDWNWRKKRDTPSANTRERRQVRQVVLQQQSEYPLEMGTVATKWGTITGGTVLMGLFFGLSQQNILLRNLVTNVENLPQNLYNMQLSNYWAATLAGDLGQTAVLYGHKTDSYAGNVELIGPKGEWNSTYCPREFKLNSNDTGLTASEVYAGIDGLLMGMQVNEWDSTSRRLSHLLEMYYSEDGVLYDKTYRACDRMENFRYLVVRDELEEQATGFAYAYMLYPGVASAAQIPLLGFNSTELYVTRSADSLFSFINNVDYPDCDYDVQEDDPEDDEEEGIAYNDFDDIEVETSHDLYILLDMDLASDNEIQEVKNIISYLTSQLHNGSRVALYFADGSNLEEVWKMNYDTSVSCYACEIQALEINRGSSMDIESIFEQFSDVLKLEEEDEKEANVRGTNSKVTLIIAPRTEYDDDNDIEDRYDEFLDNHGYMRFLVLGDSTWSQLFGNSQIISMSSNEETVANTVFQELIELPARLLDPMCDDWDYNENRNQDYHIIYLTPNTVKYYELNSIYFHVSSKFWIKIEGDDGYVSVCVSRTNKLPNVETSNDDLNCYETSSGEKELEISFTDACENLEKGDHARECNNVYLSFEALPTTSTSDRCDEMDCTRPDQLQVEVFLEDTKCGACGLLASPFLWLMVAIVLLVQRV